MTIDQILDVISIVISSFLAYSVWKFGHRATKKDNFRRKWNDYYLDEIQQLNDFVSEISIALLLRNKDKHIDFNKLYYHQWKIQTYLIELHLDEYNELDITIRTLIRRIAERIEADKKNEKKELREMGFNGIKSLQKKMNKEAKRLYYLQMIHK